MEGLVGPLPAVVEVPQVPGPSVHTLEVANENRTEIALAVDATKLELLEPSFGRALQRQGKVLDGEVIIGPPRPSWRGYSPLTNDPGWSRRRTWRCASVAENTWGREPPGSLPQTLQGRSDLGWYPRPSLRGMGLCLSVVPSFDGVTDIAVVADPVAHGGTPGRKVTLRSCRGLAPRVCSRSKLLPKVSPLLPAAYGACASKRSPLGVAVAWDDRESATQC
jgi:hypothetical protein